MVGGRDPDGLSGRTRVLYYITNLLRLNRKWSTYNRGSNDNFKFSWINYFPNCHNGFRKRLLSIDVRFPSINAEQAIGNIVSMIRKQDQTDRLKITRTTSIQSYEKKQVKY